MASTTDGAAATASNSGGSGGEVDQVTQLKGYLETIVAKQEQLKEQLKVKHNKAVVARRLSTQVGGQSLRNVMVELDKETKGGEEDGNGNGGVNNKESTVDVVETPGMQKRLEDYSLTVDALEKELEETTKLVNEVATAIAVLSAGGGGGKS